MFTNIPSRHKTDSALERLGFEAHGRGSMLSSAVMPAACLGGGMASSLAASFPSPFDSRFAALVGRRQDALRNALLARSLPFSNPLNPLSTAASPMLSMAESFRQEALVNQVFRRRREETLVRLIQAEALVPSFLPGYPASLPAASVVAEPLVKADLEHASEVTNDDALEALGNFGIERRNRNVPYFDASKLDDPDPVIVRSRRTRGGITEPFPEKLHRMLREAEEAGESDVISFFPHGRAFAIHHAERFCREVMPRYFKLSRLSSFQRQLNLYGFTRVTAGPDTGGYYHELFLKGRPALSIHMRRVGAPKADRVGRSVRPANPPSVPDFYSMSPVKIAGEDVRAKPSASSS